MSGTTIHWTALSVFAFFFILVTVLGFMAARWKSGNLNHLHEWGLGGRRFGTVITWFLVGGDFYTAYTIIAVPALVYAVGAYGFFALPYTIIVYPLVFTLMPRLWSVCHKHNYVTTADFVGGRYSNRWLALAVAWTGILATMPYIALQLVGMQVVIEQMGIGGEGIVGDVPLIIAFIILALYTYASGLRAPAMIAFVKDIMIYVVVIAAIAVIPMQMGGYGHVFELAGQALAAKQDPAKGLILSHSQLVPFATLAFGSALAAFMYPHTVTGVLSSSSGNVVRKNAILLPAYTILLGLIAMLGFMGMAAGITVKTANQIVPALFEKIFPEWFVGFSFSAIAIGALVPASIMSIGAANIFTRNVWKAFVNPQITHEKEAEIAKFMSLIVKVGALAFILFLPTQFSINLQLLGGVWILQTFPAIVLGLYRTRVHPVALLLGWAVGMTVGSWMAFSIGVKPVYPIVIGGETYSIYIGIIAVVVNLIVSMIANVGLRFAGHHTIIDQTEPGDYEGTVSQGE